MNIKEETINSGKKEKQNEFQKLCQDLEEKKRAEEQSLKEKQELRNQNKQYLLKQIDEKQIY